MEINLHQLEKVAREVCDYIQDKEFPTVLLLIGELGSGKTTFTKILCEKLGVMDVVSSPTFIIQNEYKGLNRKIYHLDLYRIENETEIVELDLKSLIRGNNLVIIEWPDKYLEQVSKLTPYTIYMNFKHLSHDTREVIISYPK